MGTHRLIPHEVSPPRGISSVDVRMTRLPDEKLMLRWHVNGQDALHLPPFAGKGRAEDLWQTTCFEMFIKDRDGQGYTEFNFSPSERWAAYRFSGYREGMSEAPMDDPPEITFASGDQLFVMTVMVSADVLDGAGAIGLSAVIEEKCGRQSFWALAHPRADKPDFHDAACFALSVEATG